MLSWGWKFPKIPQSTEVWENILFGYSFYIFCFWSNSLRKNLWAFTHFFSEITSGGSILKHFRKLPKYQQRALLVENITKEKHFWFLWAKLLLHLNHKLIVYILRSWFFLTENIYSVEVSRTNILTIKELRFLHWIKKDCFGVYLENERICKNVLIKIWNSRVCKVRVVLLQRF